MTSTRNSRWGVLPDSLTHLKFTGRFDQPIGVLEGMLPQGLIHLELGGDFNHPVAVGVLPPSLTIVNLGWNFRQPIRKGVLPRGFDTSRARRQNHFHATHDYSNTSYICRSSIGSEQAEEGEVGCAIILYCVLDRMIHSMNISLPIRISMYVTGLTIVVSGVKHTINESLFLGVNLIYRIAKGEVRCFCTAVEKNVKGLALFTMTYTKFRVR